jgi:hypothetical protein
MKFILSILCLLLGLLLLAAGVGIKVVQYYTAPEQLHQMAMEGFEENVISGRLDLGHLETYGLTMAQARDIALSPPEADTPVVSAPLAKVSLHPGQLLRGEFVPESVVIESPTLYVEYDPEAGQYNLERIRFKPPEPPVVVPDGLLRHGVVIQDATINLREPTLFRDAAVRTYTGVHLVVMPDPASADRWLIDGRISGAPLSGTRVSGFVYAGENTRMHLDIEADHLRVDEEFWNLVPEGHTIWRDYKLAGRASCDVSVDIRDGETEFYVTARMEKGTANVTYYPMPLHSVNGTVLVTPESVQIEDATGLISTADQGGEPGLLPSRVRVNGSYDFDGRTLTRVEADNVLMTQRTIGSIPEAGERLWSRFQPAGRGSLDLVISTPGGEAAQTMVSAECRLRNASARVALQDPATDTNVQRVELDRLSGTITYGDTGVELGGLQAWVNVPQPHGEDVLPGRSRVRVLAEGLYDPEGSGTEVDVMVYDLQTNEALMTLTPELTSIWEMLQPEVQVDLEASIYGDLNEAVNARILADVHGGTIKTQSFPMALEQVMGSLSIRIKNGDTRIMVEEMKALLPSAVGDRGPMYRAGSLQAHGLADLGAEHYEFNFIASDVDLSRQLLMGLPGDMGEEVWDLTQPEGIISVSGRVMYDPRKEVPVRSFLDVNLMDVSGQIKGLPITGATGHVLITEGRALSNQISGIVGAGRFQGAAVFYYGPEMTTSYGATLSVTDVKVGQVLQNLTGEESGVEGLVQGTVDIGGVMGGATSPMIRGHVELSQGKLWETPLFTGLLPLLRLSVPGEDAQATGTGSAQFKYVRDQLIIDKFQYTGPTLNISGEGSIGPHEKLRLTLVAIGSKSEGGGIPVVSDVLGWFWTAVESQLFRVRVRGTLDNPEYNLQPLSGITAPLRDIGQFLTNPFLGSPKQ